MNKTLSITACVFALLAVVFGAMGAHLLKDLLPSESLSSFETAVRYQMYHALALLVLGLTNKINSKAIGVLFITGICLFSGSIYILSTQSLLNFGNVSFLGPITPLGGMILISGWAVLIIKIIQQKPD